MHILTSRLKIVYICIYKTNVGHIYFFLGLSYN